MKFQILPEANVEAASAMAWYDDQHSGLGVEFLAELQIAYEQVQANSGYIPRLERYPGPYLLRRLVMKRFPYQVIFSLEDDEIVVIAVAHNRREPFYWIDRLP